MSSQSVLVENLRAALLAIVCLLWVPEAHLYASPALGLDQAIAAAQQHDPWLHGNQQSQFALESEAIAAGTLPDPTVSLGVANLPVDTFDFNQEAMTQFKVGVSQMFPRGDTRTLQRKKLLLMSTQYPYLGQNRLASVKLSVTHAWLDAFKAQQSIALIEDKRALFEQLPQLARFGYASALARSRQQDVVRAELELTRLEDRLQVLYQQQEVARRGLGEWLSQRYAQIGSAPGNDISAAAVAVEARVPTLPLRSPELVAAGEVANEQLATRLMRHPSVLAIEREILASGADIELSQQQYKPEWGVNVSYGYRDDDPMGAARADFLSLGVSVDLPLFTANRQDRQYQASIARAEAVKTQKWLLLRRMLSAYEVSRARLQRLTQRQQLYAQQLVPQMELQAEAALSAYTHDEGDFAEVVRSRIALVNAQIDELAIAVDRLKAIAELNYFTTAGSAHDNGTTQGEEK